MSIMILQSRQWVSNGGSDILFSSVFRGKRIVEHHHCSTKITWDPWSRHSHGKEGSAGGRGHTIYLGDGIHGRTKASKRVGTSQTRHQQGRASIAPEGKGNDEYAIVYRHHHWNKREWSWRRWKHIPTSTSKELSNEEDRKGKKTQLTKQEER